MNQARNMKIMKSRNGERTDQKKTRMVFATIECKKSRKSATNKSKQANTEKMRRRQGDLCDSQRANKKNAKQRQGEEMKKRASNNDKHTTKIQTRRR